MAFIGNTVTTQGFTPAVDYFNGNGSTTAFTLSKPVASVAQVQAVISNVPQNPGSAYTVSGNTITFTSAPPTGTSNIYVYYTSPITQVIQPSQGTVNTTQLGTVTNIASGNSSLTLQTGSSNTTALTLDTSQNATFVGTLATSAKGITKASLPTGSVLQVLQTTTTTATSTTSTTYTDVTNLNVSITPSSATNKILVLCDLRCYIQADNSTSGGLQLLRGSTAVYTDDRYCFDSVNANVGYGLHGTFIYLDSPATTSSTTYKIQIKRTSSVGTSYSFDINPHSGNISSITVMEIVA